MALSLIVVISMVVSAAPTLSGSTTKSLSTNYTLVNLGTTAAKVTAEYVKTDGTPWSTNTDNTIITVDNNFGQKIIAQYFDTTMSAGRGSVVLSSTEPLGAVVQILARGQVPTSGAYAGVSVPSNKYYVPQVLRNRLGASGISNTQISIQSTESTTATTSVTVNFIPYPGSGYSTFNKTGISIPAKATFLYDIADESASNLPDGWYGSAVVTAETGKNIAVVVSIFSGANSLQTFNAFPQESITSTWSVPLFTSRLTNGLSTPVVVQNLSGGSLAAGAITMSSKSTVSSPATFSVSNTDVVPDTSSYAFNPVTNTPSLPANWTGACRVTLMGTNAKGVVYVQMRRPGVSDEIDAYNAFPSNSTNTRVVVPLVSKRQPNGFATAVTIQNLDPTNDALVRLTYTPAAAYVTSGGSSTLLVFNNVKILADGNQVENQRLSNGVAGMPDGWYGTLLVEPQPSTTARPIAAFVQLTNWQGVAGDTLMAYDAFLLP